MQYCSTILFLSIEAAFDHLVHMKCCITLLLALTIWPAGLMLVVSFVNRCIIVQRGTGRSLPGSGNFLSFILFTYHLVSRFRKLQVLNPFIRLFCFTSDFVLEPWRKVLIQRRQLQFMISKLLILTERRLVFCQTDSFLKKYFHCKGQSGKIQGPCVHHCQCCL